MGVAKEQHIVMLPLMPQCHLIPFLALANQITQRFPFKITIVTTPLNLRYLQTAASNHSPQIHFSELPLNAADHGLPPKTENTDALPLNLSRRTFGSQNTVSQHQMMALALGLEDSGRPFIWSIRPPTGFNSRDEFKPEWLPEGFEERGQGLVVRSWAPQLEIFCHRSTGAFVSHCGWNSVVESLSQGVPIIGWPLAAEQGYNAKMLVEEMGVCVEMTRGVESQISREDVKRVIEEVMDGGSKAVEMRKKAVAVGELI
ncbi:hypothetical protein SASPL_131367 [Salvia splendens]|uniref:UDP-glycosyltransferases domain-containing protein n=1 Tax=Salvia splendens TaxID=180675 RepID=A0A8X8ZK89_SALSN|nr:hypothetical protein SASPL_131367 [Salvia splendens]